MLAENLSSAYFLEGERQHCAHHHILVSEDAIID